MLPLKHLKTKIIMISCAVILLELLQSYLIIEIVKNLISDQAFQISKEYYGAALATIAIPMLSYAQAYYSQATALNLKRIEEVNINLAKGYQTYIHYLTEYMTNAPLELNNRIGLGVISSANFIVARAIIIFSLLIALLITSPILMKLIAIILIPLGILMLATRQIQRHYGTQISVWIAATPEFISQYIIRIIKNEYETTETNTSAPIRILAFTKLLAAQQATSSVLKPALELIVLTTLILTASEQAFTQMSEPLTLAITYRLYSNGTTLISQYSLMQSNLPAIKGFSYTQKASAYDSSMVKTQVKKMLTKNRVEIRGKSGVGKSTTLEWIAGQLSVNGRKYHYLTAEFLPEKSSVNEFHNEYQNIFPNLKNVPPGEKIENLSLGQKKSLILSIALHARRCVILLDEPFANLDTECSKIARHHLENTTNAIIITNHEVQVNGFHQFILS